MMAAAFGYGQQSKPLDPANMDPSVKPSVDFYDYANGGWLKNNPVPADQRIWASFTILREKNNDALHNILEDAANASASKGSNLQKVGDMYASGMDTAAIEANGIKPLQEAFNTINSITGHLELMDAFVYFQQRNITVAFNFGSGQDFKNSSSVIAQIGQGGLGLPDRDYYFNDDSKKLREQYVDHIAKMLTLAGDDPTAATQEATTVMDFETSLAKISMKREDRRDPEKVYHKMTMDQLNALTPNFSWPDFFQAIRVPNIGDVNVAQPEYLAGFNTMLSDVPLDTWKLYLRWQLLNQSAEFLNKAFVDEDFNFNQHILSGVPEQQPRWKRVQYAIDGTIGDALGQLYVEKYFPPEAKKAAREMIANLRKALRDRITNLTWMSEATKKQALKKLDAFGVKVGYTDKWRDYSTLDIDRGPYVQNMMRAGLWAVQYELNKIGQPVDKTEWGMTPPTVNAYYSPTHNEIVFPAGILQPPFFDPKADAAVNYGGMGAVIGHEMTHGFDDQGRKFDGEGNLKDWWTSDDSAKYVAQSNILVNQYNQFVAADTFHLNGRATLGENTADLGGLTVAYAAFKMTDQGKSEEKIDDLTPDQRFFLAWAQVWRNTIRPEELIRRVKIDYHSPGKFRVLGPLSNMDEFFKAFGVKPGDPMRRPPEDQAKIW